MAHTMTALEAELPSFEMSDLTTEILASSLRSIGLFDNGTRRIADLRLDRPPVPHYERWLDGSIRHLQEQRVLGSDLTFLRDIRPVADLWDEWEEKVPVWASDPRRQARAGLLKACLERLPAVLRGDERAADVIFPNSSTHLVDAIHRDDPRAGYCHDVLAATLSAWMDRQLESDPERTFRIIEIGAGMGGTTAALLPVVGRYPVEEYRYTDVSEAFLTHAEKQFGAVCPVLATSLFDVSLPLESQAVAMNHYDVAIAANVFFATANVRSAVRNAKALLKNEGILLLDEISTWSLFDHLTFGLLEEWLRYEDPALRRPGSPGLSPETWRELLTTEGFESIAFPAEEAHRFGQQIISAASNGWTRQRIAKVVVPLQPVPVATEAPALLAPPASPGFSEQLAVDHIRNVITSKLADALRMNASLIRDDAPFAGYGVDSIVGVNLVRTISEALKIDLEPTSLFEYSTVDELAGYILKQWPDRIAAQVAQLSGANGTSAVTAHAKPPAVLPSAEPQEIGKTRFTTRFTGAADVVAVEERERFDAGVEPIAIIGMSGRFAESESLEAFWQHLAEGHDLVTQVSRWSPEACVMANPGEAAYCSYGSFIGSIDQFDPAFFGLTEQEATYMDPQQRLFLEESWRALEDAGYASKGVSEKQCGVYAGCGSSKYDRLHPREIPPAHAFWGNSSAVTPARIAYLLNLQGPALAVDTACSSSLVAIHLACQGLWSGETEMALAGGVFLNTTPAFFQVANRANMLSPDGKCYSFDSRANGFVPGEGVGVLVLKRLSDAMADGDYIHGVIAGSGINQDGRSNGLTAPNGRAQERLERSVYDRFKIDPATIQVVEAHGTGSLLGDSVEHAALTRAFREHTDKRQFCALGTVKTNIGHTSAASGVAGVLKLLLSMKHRMISPSLHFQNANPAIDMESGPFYVNTELKSWEGAADQVRRAAVSSFGFGGTNAHLILDEPPAIVRRDDAARAYLVVLSARSGEQLQQQARNLLAHLARTPNVSMTDLSFTLLVGRMHFSHRLACIAQNQSELAQLLGQWVESGAAPNVYAAELQEGRAREKAALKKFGSYCIDTCKDSPGADNYAETLTAIADLYVQGNALEFGSLFPRDARRMPLPTYPFARERYWLEGELETLSLSSEDADFAFEEGEPDGPSAATVRGDFPMRTMGGTLQDELTGLVAELLAIGPGSVSPDKVLQDLGIDSVGLTKFAKSINDHYQLDLTPVVFFDYPTIGELVGYLSDKYGNSLRRVSAAASTASRPATEASTQAPAARLVTRARATSRKPRPAASSGNPAVHEPIAIVGMAGVMPQSDDLDELWDHLANGRNVITVIPRDRWNWEDGFGDPLKEANKYNTKWGGFMREVDKFDPRFFAISPREAQMMDPQQRIFLETAWKAIEDAGHKASDLSGTKTGVFAAAGNNDYKEVLRDVEGGLDGYSASGNTNSVLANRISFLLNLRGPSENIDTACSSALIALHRAINAIHSGDCDMAIVGGVNALVSPEPYIAFSKAGLLSRDGQCKTFDKRANGFVRAEGAGAVFVKRLSAAEADGNQIYAIVRSTAVNHGGRVPTMGAPSASGQSALLLQAYEKAQIDPTTVGYIECHGTGTALGDPIETSALSTAFAALYEKHGKAPAGTPHCGLGSIKTNIGHLENAAGIAGLLKVLLALKHKQLPASLNFQDLNPYIKLEGTPFYVVDKLTPWLAPMAPDGSPMLRLAGVSSFGFGGANAHVVLEEYIPAAREDRGQEPGPQLVVLSAKNTDRLKAYAQSMLTYLGKHDVELRDLAHTLQVGRDEMPERLAMVVESAKDLRQKLEQFLAGRGKSSAFYHDNSKVAAAQGTDRDALVPALVAERNLAKLADLWTAGAKIEWTLLHEGAPPKRISLPTYPFARERHWAVSGKGAETKALHVEGPAATAVLHPMIHRNVSTMTEQKFASHFSGDEFFFDDHRVEAQKVLPAVGYLEMVRAAGQLAGLPHVRTIRNITWQRPLIVGSEGEDVEVSLTPDNKDVKFSVRTVGKGQAVQNCTGKLTYGAGASTVPEVVDVAAIRARCPRQALSGPELYGPVLAGSGLELRRSFQVVQAIYANDVEALGILQIPEHLRAEAGQYFLHPALMDGAIQTFVGLVQRSGSEPLPLTLPFSMGEVQIFHPLKNLRYAHVTLAGERKLAVDMLDERGTVLVRVKDFVLRPAQRPGRTVTARESVEPSRPPTGTKEIIASLQTLTPVWDPLRVHASKPVAVPPAADVLLLGSNPAHLDWVRESFANARSAEVFADEAFEQLIWIAPEATDDRLIEQQEDGVLAVFRLIKSLLQSGYATKALRWTVITERTQRVRATDAIQAAHAGIAGLIGSVAKEYPRWDLRLLDVDSVTSVSAQECLALPWDKQGNVLAYRSGEWFQQSLARVENLPEVSALYRQNGVYVVIGGAGGVGEVWSRFMIEHHQARIVWIGRRPSDAAIEARITALAGLGNAPLYISADATDLHALERARETVLARYGVIHGVVQSAIVLQDQSIARMDESTFRSTLSAKVDVSVNMDRVFGAEKLDFMLFFSSLISFVKTPGQSNYSAGCTFKDALAQRLQQERAYPVKIMNWGYWGSVGIVADEEHKKRMARMGAASIEPEEGMASLQSFVNSGVSQVALVKVLAGATELGAAETLSCYPNAASILPAVRVTPPSVAPLEADTPAPEMMQLVTEILASSLQSVDWKVSAAPYFDRWLTSSLDYLKQQGVGREVRPLDELWTAWAANKASWTVNANREAYLTLMEACLKALPDILAGRQRPTDVMFPKSSMRLVEPIYKGNAQADYFNGALGQTLIAYLDQLLKADGNRSFRILEIGAGTGGTTAGLLPLLRQYPVEEYCYTDLSKAFLMHAEKQYRPQLPALTTAIFDVSKPFASQSIQAGHYDIAIAANVLHATPNIRETLRNAKAVLKNQGVLLLNELSTWNILAHVTFGLLEGWWLYEDIALRLPGTPGIATDKWREVLAEEGFESIQFTAPDAHPFGQQIIAAGSNGWVRQRVVKGAAPRPAPAVRPAEPVPAAPSRTPQVSSDHIRRIITGALTEALKLDPSTVRNDEPFADYGVDSIVGVNLVTTINEQLQIELETTKLFEYTTIDQLAEHIATEYRDQLPAQPAPQVRTSAPVPAVAARPTAAAERMGADFVRGIIANALSEALKLDPASIRNDEPFADYGVDSIVGVNLVTTISERLQIELETTKLFEYTTVDQLAEYIRSEFQDQLPAVAAPVEFRAPLEPVRSPEISERMAADYVRGIITDALAEALRLDVATVRGDEPFADYGVDSIIGVNLVTTISEKLQIELETTKLFEYTTVNQLADYIQSEWREQIATHLPAAASVRAAVEPELRTEHRFSTSVPSAEPVRVDEHQSRQVGTGRIAIVGISGRFAESENLDAFWQNLKEGKDLVKTVTRWPTTDCIGPAYNGRYCAEGSFIESIDRFDPAYFRISPEEAICMDPQQRLFLEESWKALEDAGYGGKSVREKQCGVYVGCIPSRYIDLMGADSPAHALWGTAESIIPTRIAYHLDLQGPAIAIDTACSSSLVAIHLACQALWTRETDMALAGGIFLQPTPGFYLMANGAGMLSKDGRCFSFDQRADGYVPGEGVGVVVLKRLEDALADGDHIHGVIAATGINQDGSSNGLVAPNARAQERLERSVYDRFGINPETIQFVEAHGSGTLLGDSIEYGALSRAFRAYTDKTQFCALGTLKTNFGHTVTAAGVAGVLKVLLAMKHRQIPPTLHIQKPSAGKALESSPFYFNSDLRDWTVEERQPRRAAVSSFGFNGTNAHLVIEEAPVVRRTIDEAAGYLLALSARTDEQLRQQAVNLIARLKGEPGLSMNDVSFTLLLGRLHLKHRVACVVRDQAEAVRLLEQWLGGGTAGQVWSSQARDSGTRENASLANLGNRAIRECRTATSAEYLENLAAIANLYVQGYALELEALFPAGSKRIPLPTYPFARERYWVDDVRAVAPVPAVVSVPAVPASSRLHPFLHRNTSVLGRQSYSSTFTSHERFEAACLEMARAAVEHAAGVAAGTVVELQNVVWGEPLAADRRTEVTIVLFAEDDESIEYEISSNDTVHCQGRAVFVAPSVATPLGKAELLTRVSAGPGDGECALPPALIGAVLQAAGSNSGAKPRSIEQLRVLQPCRGEISVVMQRQEGGVDVDLIDASGNVSVQLRGLSFQRHAAAATARRWTFAKDGIGAATMIPAAEKMTLFLRQEIALQVEKSIDDIPTDLSFFDLGLTSLGMTSLLQNIQNSCALLNEDDFSPSVLFNYTDIRSLAAYLATTYPSAIDRIAVTQTDRDSQSEVVAVTAARLTPITRKRRPSIDIAPAAPAVPVPATDESFNEILASVSWQEASLHDGYEKVSL